MSTERFAAYDPPPVKAYGKDDWSRWEREYDFGPKASTRAKRSSGFRLLEPVRSLFERESDPPPISLEQCDGCDDWMHPGELFEVWNGFSVCSVCESHYSAFAD
jgi:hypothetical protein